MLHVLHKRCSGTIQERKTQRLAVSSAQGLCEISYLLCYQAASFAKAPWCTWRLVQVIDGTASSLTTARFWDHGWQIK